MRLLRALCALLLCLCCHGNTQNTLTHLILLDDLPPEIEAGSRTHLVVRMNYAGSIEFQESDEFKVLLNISSPSIEQAYAVQTDLVEHNGQLLLQVYEKSRGFTPVTLQWIIIIVGALTGLVMLCAIGYATWWYMTHQVSDTVDSTRMYYNISQPMIQRSRNSVQTGSQQGETPMFGDEDHDNVHNEDTLREVPEEEEAETMQMERMQPVDHHLDEDEDSDENNDSQVEDQIYIKNRYLSPAKRLHKDRSKNDRKSKRRLFPGATVPPSYDSIMEYPEESGAESDSSAHLKVANKVPDALLDPYCCQGHEMTTFHSPVKPFKYDVDPSLNHSDGDLLLRNQNLLDRLHNLPVTARGLVSPTEVKKNLTPGELTRAEKLQNVKMNENKESEDREDLTPFMVSAMVHRPNLLSPDHSPYKDFRKPRYQKSKSTQDQDSEIHTLDHHPMNIPMTSFKSPLKTIDRTSNVNMQSGQSATKHSPLRGIDEVYINRQYEYGRKISPNLIQQGFIPQDPPPPLTREERVSATSYDSSELFDDSYMQEPFFNIDESDIDNFPPIEHDGDVLSEASLPLPTPPLEAIQFNFNLDNPGTHSPANNGSYSTHFARLPSEDLDNMSGTFIAATGSPAHSPDKGMFVWTGTPTGTLEHLHKNDRDTSGVPPPPKVFSPPQSFSWTREKLITDLENNDIENDDIENDDQENSRKPVQGGGEDRKKYGSLGRNKGGGIGATHLHMTLLNLCILSIVTCVFCAASSSDTKVDIVIFAPSNFLSQNPSVYFNMKKPVDIVAADAYGTKYPILTDTTSSLCTNHTCVHGCDDDTGECICLKGYRLDENSKCIDVNECIEGGVSCHPAAGCINTKGHYNCFCSGDYYGDGKTCLECNAPCKKDTYEVQACDGNTDKICRDCLAVCQDGYYIFQPCSSISNTVCRMCQPKCVKGEYEYRSCSNTQNRICRKKTELSIPVTSGNVILGDRENIKENMELIKYFQSDFDGTRSIIMTQGSDVSINIVVRHMNPVAMFRPVNHSNSNDLSTYSGKAEILQKYCPFPVPSHYELSYNIHQNVTYLNKDGHLQPCQTFTRYGSFPDFSQASEHSITCANAGPLSSVFRLETVLEPTSVVWAEKSQDCEWNREKCENCTRNCARQMALSNYPDCHISDSDSDNGLSPRLHTCYSCCAADNCTALCQDHNNLNCRTERCANGNLVEYHLKPVFKDGDHFYCHLIPVLDQLLIQLEYTVTYGHTQLYQGSLTIHSDQNWQKTGKISEKDKILNVDIDAKLTSMPDFLEYGLSLPNIKVGKYSTSGPRVEHSVVRSSSVTVRPLQPFGINPYLFGNQSCDDEVMKDVVIATGVQGPYEQNIELLALKLGDKSYAITNKTVPPYIRIWIDKETSVLKGFFPDTRLIEDSLTTTLEQTSSHWIVNVSAKIEFCPGLLRVNISKISYPLHSVFNYEVGIRCPVLFNLSFAIPTGDYFGHKNDIVVTIGDIDTVYQLTLHKPTLNQNGDGVMMMEKAMKLDSTTEKIWDPPLDPPHLSVPFVASVCGAVVLLLFLATFGTLLSSDLPERDVVRVRCCHLLVMVCYITIQFVYAVMVTMCVFVFILLAVNNDTVSFLKNYHQQRSVKTAFSRLELDRMQLHLVTEIDRQNQIANQTKEACEQSMMTVINDISNMRKKLEKDTKSLIDKKSLHHLISLHTREVLQQFSHSLHKFRDKYDIYISSTLRNLASDIKQTYESISHNKWLVGPKFVHGTMANIRTLLSNKLSRPFMEWADLETDLSKLTSDLSLPLPQLPSFNDILQDDIGKWNSGKEDSRRRDSMMKPSFMATHNFWFYLEQEKVKPQNSTVQKDGITLPSKMGRSQPDMRLYYLFFGLMVFLDLVLFLHRMVKSLGVCNLLVYGYPVYVDLREKSGQSVDVEPEKQKASCLQSNCFTVFKYFWKKVMSTFFIPKVIALASICLMVYLVSVVAHNFVNREIFGYLGYYNNMDDLLSLHETAINTRIKSHAEHITTLEFPFQEELMKSYINRQQVLISMQGKQWEDIRTAHEEMYCTYMNKMDDTVQCGEQRSSVHQLRVEGCKYMPVIPQLYKRKDGKGSTIAENQMDGFLHSTRKLISDSSYVVLIYLSVIVVKELLGTVIWIFMKRAGLLNLRIIYETNESLTSRDK